MEGLVAAFGLGLLTAASPCLLPLYPGFLAYLAANAVVLQGRRGTAALGLLVLAGVLTTMLVAGIVLTLLAAPMSRLLAVLVPAADLVLIVLGVLLLVGRNPFARLSTIRAPATRSPFAQSFVYGLVLGPLALPCAGAYLVALLAISIDPLDAAPRVLRFIAFGLGFGLPLVLLSVVAAARGQAIVRSIARHHATIERIGGAALLVIGAGDLISLSVNGSLSLGG